MHVQANGHDGQVDGHGHNAIFIGLRKNRVQFLLLIIIITTEKSQKVKASDI